MYSVRFGKEGGRSREHFRLAKASVENIIIVLDVNDFDFASKAVN